MSKPRSTASLIVAIVLLTLPLLYIGSYLALVDPVRDPLLALITPSPDPPLRIHDYRVGGQVATMVFWPLEQVDRNLRPDLWMYEYVEGLDLMIVHGPDEPSVAGSSAASPAVGQQLELFNALQRDGKQTWPPKK